MKTEYFPSSDTLSFVFSEGPVEDGRDVEGDEDVLIMYDEQERIVEILVHHASRRIALDQISAVVVTGQQESPTNQSDTRKEPNPA